MAERVGFEPTERFPAHSISSAANSTTLAPLRGGWISDCGFRIADLKSLTSFKANQNSQPTIGGGRQSIVHLGIHCHVSVKTLSFLSHFNLEDHQLPRRLV